MVSICEVNAIHVQGKHSEQLCTPDKAVTRVLETMRLRLANAVTALAADPHQTQHTGGLG
ncbi:hypothetical protein PgNI_06390 [Pyricularia grisea]|uniref:Uncharacterized protein n=1 Tax=Pyricularia grisea TaxID=148305 RepID=A0A6P8B5L1_PYRGI|nr:hypothetical protein PgNI_06390 [Pyricularia grisea]TLD10540.1 hypothetical protein PgNI_06390 [Pyricularia grisea]